jgi:hypothetical protein
MPQQMLSTHWPLAHWPSFAQAEPTPRFSAQLPASQK